MTLLKLAEKGQTMYPKIANAMKTDKTRKQIRFKADGLNIVLKLNNTKQYVNITDGKTNNSVYGKISMTGKPLFKANTIQAIKYALESLENDTKLSSKLELRLIGECSVCGKELSDPRSMELGVGPECRDNIDFESEEEDE